MKKLNSNRLLELKKTKISTLENHQMNQIVAGQKDAYIRSFTSSLPCIMSLTSYFVKPSSTNE